MGFPNRLLTAQHAVAALPYRCSMPLPRVDPAPSWHCVYTITISGPFQKSLWIAQLVLVWTCIETRTFLLSAAPTIDDIQDPQKVR
jgi:hypothetical protein